MRILSQYGVIPGDRGTYALILGCAGCHGIKIGRLGVLRLEPGFYVYIGSALGPGGLRARLAHHTATTLKPHWHVDYLRAKTEVEAIWFSVDPSRREHQWAAAAASLPGATIPMPRFGSSDCQCPAHLFRIPAWPSYRVFLHRLRLLDAAHPAITELPYRQQTRPSALPENAPHSASPTATTCPRVR